MVTLYTFTVDNVYLYLLRSRTKINLNGYDIIKTKTIHKPHIAIVAPCLRNGKIAIVYFIDLLSFCAQCSLWL
jgi:hypothetical protein